MVFASPTMMARALARAAAMLSHASSQARIGSGTIGRCGVRGWTVSPPCATRFAQANCAFVTLTPLDSSSTPSASSPKPAPNPPAYVVLLYAEPNERGERQISAKDRRRHRDEIAAFVQLVDGDEVTFLSSSYRRRIDAALPVADAEAHLAHLRQRFGL
jgi:hypothetical protein